MTVLTNVKKETYPQKKPSEQEKAGEHMQH
jgi:hypothetical protein